MPRKTTETGAAARPPTWTNALTRFFGHLVEQEKSDHTQKNYREDLLAFTDWYQTTYQERPDLKALAPAELREWKAHLRDDRQLEPAHRQPQAGRPAIVPHLGRRRGPGRGDRHPQVAPPGPAPAPMARPQGAAPPDPRRGTLRRCPRRMPGPAPAEHRHPGRGGHRPAMGRHPGPRALGHADRPQGQGTQAAVDPPQRRGPRRPHRAPGHRARRRPPRSCTASAGR